jgi:DNA-binding MarR family transcriptional regulator
VPEPLPFDPIAEAAHQWEAHWAGAARESMVAVTSIMRAQQILLARLNDLLADLDLTFPRYEALMLLYYSRRNQLPLGKISDRLQVHRASVTNVIDKLVDSGYVERTTDDNDRRAVLARITTAGQLTAARATQRVNDAAFGMEPLTPEVCKQIAQLLEPLRRGAGDFHAAGTGAN